MFLLLVILFSFNSCETAKNYAKVDDITASNKVVRGIHIVDHGESLYSIAFRYGRDYRKLAAINSIQYPYKIMRDQKIYLNKPSYNIDSSKYSRPNFKSKIAKHQNLTKISIDKHLKKQHVSRVSWGWPVKGKISSRFGDRNKLNKGIDIVVNNTSSVKSASDGIVVYKGAGLKGYGKLIIIKHSEQFLSAYAHNDVLLVNEGQKVKQGQNIAMIGKVKKNLHFEIRKNGKPDNPLKYLAS